MSQLLSDLYPPYTSGGFNWTTDNEVTTDQSPTTANLGQRYAFTQSTAADKTITLPSVGASEDGKWFAIYNASQYTITITASDSDTIGWPALVVSSIEILPNTVVTLQYQDSTTKWHIVKKTGGQCRPSGTVLYLPMNELNTFDTANATPIVPNAAIDKLSGYGYNGVKIGVNSGKFDSCYDFDGTTDYLSFADSTDWDIFGSTTGDVTLCGWVYCDDAAGSIQRFVGHFEDATAYQWVIMRASTGSFNLYFRWNNIVRINISGGALAQNTWHHVAVVRIGAEVGIYVDGAQVNYISTFATYDLTGPLVFCRWPTGIQYFDGKTDDWAIVYSNIFGAEPNDNGTTGDDTFTVDTLNPLVLVI